MSTIKLQQQREGVQDSTIIVKINEKKQNKVFLRGVGGELNRTNWFYRISMLVYNLKAIKNKLFMSPLGKPQKKVLLLMAGVKGRAIKKKELLWNLFFRRSNGH